MNMNIEQKLKTLEDESRQIRLQLVIKDIELFDYYQLMLLNNQITNRLESLKQQMEDMKQDQERERQLKQIKSTKERTKRPTTKLERVDNIIIRAKPK